MKFAGSNTTLYADSRLKFRRNFIYLLQKLYLLDSEEILPLIEHILKNSNTAKTCSVLSDHGFLQIITFAYIHLLQNVADFEDFLSSLFSVAENDVSLQERILHLLALVYAKRG